MLMMRFFISDLQYVFSKLCFIKVWEDSSQTTIIYIYFINHFLKPPPWVSLLYNIYEFVKLWVIWMGNFFLLKLIFVLQTLAFIWPKFYFLDIYTTCDKKVDSFVTFLLQFGRNVCYTNLWNKLAKVVLHFF